MKKDMITLSSLLTTSLCLAVCFTLIGIGILFFGRENIGGDCRKAPEDRKDGCLSKNIGICPMDDKENYLKFATRASRLRR